MQFLKSNNRKSFLILIAAGILLEILYLFFLLKNGKGDTGLFMFIYFETFVIFFFAFYLIKNSVQQNENNSKLSTFLAKVFAKNEKEKPDIKIPLIIILFGILFRITLLPAAPASSPDVYRYIWEGKVLYNGFNPYEYSPDAKQLEHLQDSVYSRVTFKDLPSIYPPFAQVIFLTSYSIFGKSVAGLKIVYLLFEIITMIFLLKLLILKKKNPDYIILYSWLPLPIMEYFVNVHIDVVGISLLVLFVYFLEKEKRMISVFAFTLSVLTKLYPIFLIPLLVKKLRAQKFVYFILIFLFTSAIFYFPFISGSVTVTKALMGYINRWEFNASVYYLLSALFHNNVIAREVCGILLFISIGYIAIYYKDFLKGAFHVLLAVIIFSPVVYPWYLGWIAALNPFTLYYSALSLFFTINLSNFSPLGKVWHEYFPVIAVEYLIFFSFLAYDLYHHKTGKTIKDLLK